MKTYFVKFKSLTCLFSGIVYAPYSISVEAYGFDDAQDKAIEYVESKNLQHDEIIEIKKP